MKINLASGQRPFKKPWVNIDIRNQGYAIDIEADIRNLNMFDDNSCDILVAHHVVEHFDMSEVGNIAKEWYRVLKPNGVLAVCVPNNEEIIKAWQEKRIDDYIFNVNMYGAYQGHLEDLHRWSYHYEYLKEQMGGDALWSRVRKLDPSVQQSDSRYNGADISYDFWILAMEFTK